MNESNVKTRYFGESLVNAITIVDTFVKDKEDRVYTNYGIAMLCTYTAAIDLTREDSPAYPSIVKQREDFFLKLMCKTFSFLDSDDEEPKISKDFLENMCKTFELDRKDMLDKMSKMMGIDDATK